MRRSSPSPHNPAHDDAGTAALASVAGDVAEAVSDDGEPFAEPVAPGVGGSDSGGTRVRTWVCACAGVAPAALAEVSEAGAVGPEDPDVSGSVSGGTSVRTCVGTCVYTCMGPCVDGSGGDSGGYPGAGRRASPPPL